MAETGLLALFQYVNIQSATLFVTVLGLYYFLFKRDKQLPNSPPGPRGWPVFGNLLSLTLHSEREMLKWNMEYGPVCRLKMASIDFVILGNAEVVDEAFVKKSNVFSDRMQNSIPGLSGDNGIIFLNYGIRLKEQRRFGLAALREFGMGRRSIEPSILEKCSELCDRIEGSCEKDEPFAVDFMIYETISSVISQLVFHKNLMAENEEFRQFVHLIMTGSKYSAINGLTVFYPGLRAIPPFSWGYTESTMYEAKTFQLMQGQIDDHKKTRDPKDPRDIIDCFLNEMDAANKSVDGAEAGSFNDAQLNYLVRDLFLAGSETTSSTICWTILFLSRQREIQAKLQCEIDDVLGHAKEPSSSIADKMPYAKAVIQETLRIRPIAPIGVPHVAQRDDTISGYHIPKGTVVVANIFGIHHDEKQWPNPENFDPTRHLDADGIFVKSPNTMPFSVGPRQCLGQQLANMELFLIVVSLFQRFSFTFAPGQDIDMRGQNIFSLRPFPFQVIASRR